MSVILARPMPDARHGNPLFSTKEGSALVAAKTDVRPKITMACQECKHRNYITKKNRRNDPDRLELKKFCPNCNLHRCTARPANPTASYAPFGSAAGAFSIPAPVRC